MAVSGGDQLISELGTWRYGIVPGLASIEAVADDVHSSQLHLSTEHLNRGAKSLNIAFLNAKGFGGNNATATVLAPHIAEQLLERKHGMSQIQKWRDKVEGTRE